MRLRTFAEDWAREYALRRLLAVAAACQSPNPVAEHVTTGGPDQ